MPQVFHPSANSISKASIIVLVLLAVGLFGPLFGLARSSWVTGINVTRQQPLQFSHERHVAGNGMDCRYCHTSVETAPFAGIPPTKTCMNCHSQIWSTSEYLAPVRSSFQTGTPLEWTRVHDLPDFVYFDHSIHVSKGVGCSTCHGRVDLMPLVRQEVSLQMDWCLDCHRNPELYVRPPSEVFRMDYTQPSNQAELGARLVDEYKIQRLTDCSACHR